MPPRAKYIPLGDWKPPQVEQMTSRTLHPSDGRFRSSREDRDSTLDRMVTVSMPRVDFGNPTPGFRVIDWKGME